MYHFHKIPNSKAIRYTALVVALIFYVGMLSACAGGGNYGHLIGTKDIDNPLREGAVAADYQYYQTPNKARSNAIIAIHKEYTLDAGDIWTSSNVSGKPPQSWKVYTGSMGSAPLLLEIQGPGKEHIGLWYSIWTSTVVKMLGDNKVKVYPPVVKSGFKSDGSGR
jgi:hypothetical protein